MKRQVSVAIVVAMLGGGVLSGYAVAGAAAPVPTVYGCAAAKTGALRIVATAHTKCKKGERRLSLSTGTAVGTVAASGANGAAGQVGATGATGSVGVTGATGATGAKGDDGLDGADGATGATGPIFALLDNYGNPVGPELGRPYATAIDDAEANAVETVIGSQLWIVDTRTGHVLPYLQGQRLGYLTTDCSGPLYMGTPELPGVVRIDHAPTQATFTAVTSTGTAGDAHTGSLAGADVYQPSGDEVTGIVRAYHPFADSDPTSCVLTNNSTGGLVQPVTKTGVVPADLAAPLSIGISDSGF